MITITKLEIKVNGGKDLSASFNFDEGKDVDFVEMINAVDAAEKSFCKSLNS